MPAVLESQATARLLIRRPPPQPLLVRRRELLTVRMQAAQLLPTSPTSPAEEANAGWYVVLMVGLAGGLVLLAYTLEFFARVGH